MRISDWSSDVCSSDLRGRRDFAEVEVRRKPGRALDRRQVARGVIIGDFGQEVPERGLRAFLARGPDVKSLGPVGAPGQQLPVGERSEEHTSELQSLMRISYAVFCLKKKKHTESTNNTLTTRQNYTHNH